MKNLIKIINIILIITTIILSYYILMMEIDNSEKKDNQQPKIELITGNTTGTLGRITTIYATFSDNVGITEAILYYKFAMDDKWNSTDIINGSADIIIPKDSKENGYYYVIVNDAAGNGPLGKPSNDGSKFFTIEVSSPAEDLIHYAFIEEGTVTWCNDCSVVRDIIHSLFESGKYNFYYVSMVLDKNEIAEERLKNDYNILGFPTLYIDGGFSVVTEHKNDESFYAEALKRAESRDAKKVNVTVKAEYLKNSNKIMTNVIVDNYEEEKYKGHLRVYLTEINSRWINKYSSEPKPYHYGFINYIYNEEIKIESYDSIDLTLENKIRDFTFSDLDPENLMVIAAVFNSEPIKKFSYPEDKNPFDAYFADNANAAKVVEGGNLPPEVGICRPETGKLHLFGNPISNTLYRNTIIIGKTIVKTCIDDDTGIEKVEFYIDDKLLNTDRNEPFEWTFNKIGLFRNIIRKHTIMIKVYDESGKTSSDSLEVIAIFL